jgi:hypothetical protein
MVNPGIKGGCDFCGRFAAKPAAWIDRAPTAAFRRGASKVASRLGVIVGILPTRWISFRHRESSMSDVVHDQVRLGEYEIGTVASIGVRVGTRHMKHTGTAQTSETVGGWASGRVPQGWGSTGMISDGRTDTNGKVLVNGVGEHLMPTAQM